MQRKTSKQTPRAGRTMTIDPTVISISAVCTSCGSLHEVPVDRFTPVAVSLVDESCLFCGRLNALRECTRRGTARGAA